MLRTPYVASNSVWIWEIPAYLPDPAGVNGHNADEEPADEHVQGGEDWEDDCGADFARDARGDGETDKHRGREVHHAAQGEEPERVCVVVETHGPVQDAAKRERGANHGGDLR